eukprot:78739-Chlamydomonas_euryale.AAC.4
MRWARRRSWAPPELGAPPECWPPPFNTTDMKAPPCDRAVRAGVQRAERATAGDQQRTVSSQSRRAGKVHEWPSSGRSPQARGTLAVRGRGALWPSEGKGHFGSPRARGTLAVRGQGALWPSAIRCPAFYAGATSRLGMRVCLQECACKRVRAWSCSWVCSAAAVLLCDMQCMHVWTATGTALDANVRHAFPDN